MNSKIEVKLGKLIEIFPYLRKIMTKSLLKMEEPHIANVCKVTTTKIKDFDEAILVIQVHVGKFGVRDVFLNGGSGMNIISKSLRKKLGLRKPKPTPFVVRMVTKKRCSELD
jgi:hypothetical protein